MNINRIYEPTNNYLKLNELNIQQIWNNYFDRYLKTNIGNVLVVFPGIQNFSAGPDFKDAIIKLPNHELIKGSIEIHLQGSDWNKHNHDSNPLYNNIILHVTLEENNKNTQTFIEGYLTPNLFYYNKKIPCSSLKLNNLQLEKRLYELAEIRFSIKSHEFLQNQNFNLKQKLFSFLHLDKQKEDIQYLINYFDILLLDQKISTYQLIFKLQHKIKLIRWQGGRSPGKTQLLKIPILIFTFKYLKKLPKTSVISLNNYNNEIISMNGLKLKLSGNEFIKEIYANIVIPYLSANQNLNLFNQWKSLPATNYGIIKKRLNIWNIKMNMNFALSQGILFLEKSYCQQNNCNNCPLFINC